MAIPDGNDAVSGETDIRRQSLRVCRRHDANRLRRPDSDVNRKAKNMTNVETSAAGEAGSFRVVTIFVPHRTYCSLRVPNKPPVVDGVVSGAWVWSPA